MSEPWIITSIERLKHDEQFKTLGPAGGFITGEQAKSFFLQSRLPPAVLGVIWNLADIDGDGKMNQNEFSIACKLINLKLRGFNLPQVLPPSLIQSAIKAEEVALTSEAPSVQSATIPAVVPAPMMPAMPTAMPAMPTTMPAMPTAIPAIPGVRPAVPAAPAASLPQAIPPLMPGSAPLIGPPPVASVMPMAAPVAQAAAPVASVAPIMATGVSLAQNQIPPMPMGNLISTNAAPPMAAGVAATAPVQPLSNTTEIPSVPPIPQTVSGPPKAPIQDPGVEWGVPQASKLKFTQVFNMSDRSKTGYISGAQARNILIQSALPQQALAQIWAISDVDNDGRLSCEEFVLAMFLCEQAKAGKGVPTVLPPDLIPPTLRRSRTSSIHSQTSAGTGTVTPAEAVLSPTSAQLALDTSFEDKRRENYEKGQAELERRRKNLLDAQRREAEERMRREREEEMKREKARQEAERKRQEELEREMHRQREIEAQKEAERKRMEETKEQARKDAERQRQEEWEKQRLLELMNVRQRQQENLLALKAKNQSLTIEISTKEDKIKELTQKISETRTGVTEVKATIDNMRNTRDTYMGDMNALKAQARDQNQRLLNLNQEKARLKARSLASAAASGAETAAVEASVTSKQMVIKQLQEKVQELENEFTAKEEDVNNNLTEFQSTKEQFLLTGERCKDLYEEYCSKRIEVLALRDKLLNPDAAWGDTGGTSWSGNSAWAASPACSSSVSLSATSSLPTSTTTSTNSTTTTSTSRYQEAPARPPPPSAQSAGRKSSGEDLPPAESPITSSTTPPWDAFANSTTTNTSNISIIHPSAETPNIPAAAPAGGERKFKALYQFDARNEDELSFAPGDIIVVIPSEGLEPGWQSGNLNNKVGWFPEAYCEPYEGDVPEVIDVAPIEAVAAVGPTEANPCLSGDGVAGYTWKATKKNQLSVTKGDKIVLRERLEGWVFGDLKGVTGWLPGNYVRGVTSPLTSPQELPEATEIPQQLDHDVISEYYVAVYPYQSEEAGDLVFETGETILVVHKEGDWWFGVVGTERSGIFPSNYVQIASIQLTGEKQEQEQEAGAEPEPAPVETQEPPQPEESIVEPVAVEPTEPEQPVNEPAKQEEVKSTTKEAPQQQASVSASDTKEEDMMEDDNDAENKEVAELTIKSPRSPKGKGKKLEVAQVIAPYDATSANQLSLVRGQLVSIRKKTASGWWEGELHAKGKKRQLGWFPASYVKVLCGSSRTTPVSMEMTGRDEYPPADFTPGAFANAFSKDVIKVDPKPKPPPPQDPETVEALYPYTAVNDDELTFSPGDLIFVLDKEDSAWWKGSLKGVIGVFPSNYVQPKSEARVVTKHDPVVVSPDADDSLCYFEDTTTASSNSWMRQSASSLRNQERSKRLTIYQCFDSPEEGMRQNVINEFIATESSYLDSLLLVQKAFIEPMKKSGVITVKEIELIFMNWSELVLVSSSFNKALKVRWRNTNDGNIHMISDILCQQIRQLQPYMRFCSLQSKGSALLNKKFEEDTAWANVIKECQERPDVAGHTLTSFLLKPLQRLTKYPLLIKKLLSFTPSEHPDYQNTVDALQAANTLCEQVNEAARQQDNTDKLEWMQSHILCDNLMERLVFNSLTNILGPRKLLHMGQLHKTKSKREIVAFLLSDFLLLTTPNKSIKSPSSLMNFERALADTTCTMYKKPLFLSDISVQLEPDSLAGFLITTSGMSIALVATSVNDRTNWLKRITLAQKHISDTERSLFHRNQSKEKDSGIVGRVLLSVMGGVDLVVPNEVRNKAPKGLLKLLHFGVKLEMLGKGVLHSFCEVSLGSQVQRTMVGTSAHPKWDSAMQFLIKSLSEDVLCITVYEKGFFRPNEFLGRAEVRIQSIFEASGDRPEPHVMRLRLQEVSKGEVILKSSLQLFK